MLFSWIIFPPLTQTAPQIPVYTAYFVHFIYVDEIPNIENGVNCEGEESGRAEFGKQIRN